MYLYSTKHAQIYTKSLEGLVDCLISLVALNITEWTFQTKEKDLKCSHYCYVAVSQSNCMIHLSSVTVNQFGFLHADRHPRNNLASVFLLRFNNGNTDFNNVSGVSIVVFEWINAGWEGSWGFQIVGVCGDLLS